MISLYQSIPSSLPQFRSKNIDVHRNTQLFFYKSHRVHQFFVEQVIEYHFAQEFSRRQTITRNKIKNRHIKCFRLVHHMFASSYIFPVSITKCVHTNCRKPCFHMIDTVHPLTVANDFHPDILHEIFCFFFIACQFKT